MSPRTSHRPSSRPSPEPSPRATTPWIAGKTCILTGASSGLGRYAAERLALMGARVVGTGRDPERCRAVARQIGHQLERQPGADRGAGRGAGHGAGGSISFAVGDYTEPASVRSLGIELLRRCPRIDVLIHNAGAMFSHPSEGWGGTERTFAVNQLSPFLLTQILWPRLAMSGERRILVVASEAHRGVDTVENWKTVAAASNPEAHSKSGWREYQVSKLANMLFARELRRRLGAFGVGVRALHPGVVSTGFARKAGIPWWWRLWLRTRSISLAQGGERLVEAVVSEPRADEGFYRADGRPLEPSAAAMDDASAQQLWQFCRTQTTRWTKPDGEPRDGSHDG